ncbi:amidohydrolase family protein [Dyella sp. LX-66]|uniref:amidohydrolase family protein n=1 Tax=unclassified Dyella TaxID=2634549 RepID=UPI001BDF7AEF|nr:MULTISPECIES: amidohydrolase family protein [unclassified Dyella]MBT2117538.1 amidohydrolase family protein [Dyella sp. LX-1]MBT2141458.1 amidohydrolase family protein [Dyella sp. LX-66]
MRKVIALVSLCLMIPLLACAQTPTGELALPPPTAQRFAIVSSTARHGTSMRWTAADGTKMGRESVLLRGLTTETDSASHVGSDGMFDRVVVHGQTSFGDAAETFAIKSGVATWKSAVDSGSAAYHSPAEYLSYGGPFDVQADFIETLLAKPDKSLSMLPSGQAHAETLTSVFVGQGASKKKVTAYVITGVNNTPFAIWVDESSKVFAEIDSLSYIPEGYESAVPMLQKAQGDALASRSRDIARKFLKKPAGPVAFVNVRAFVDGSRFVDGQTVVVEHGLITQVGLTGSVKVPKHADVIDGAGKTLVPGLWDAHQHIGGDAVGPELLSLGITSIRDPGNVNTLTLSRMARRAKGELLIPHVYPSSLIDGKGPFTAQLGSVATSQEQAIALVRQAKADGFDAIKIYGSFNPAWVSATTAEAHRLGLHVHGHLPFGMRPAQAIADGYDEITHIFYVIMEAMPDSVVSATGLTRVQGTARYSKDVDLHAEPMKSLVATMAQRKITVDPTLSVVEAFYARDNGDLSPAYAPFAGTLPASFERGLRQGGLAVPAGLTRADYRASFAKLQSLVSVLHEAGVPIVAGTDGYGMELVRELELYVDAGLSTTEALASATIVPAHLVGADKRTGSIDVGKTADLLLVNGNPQANISALRQTKLVMMDGVLMDADALRAIGGFSGAPAN